MQQDMSEYSLFSDDNAPTEFVCPVRREINAAYEGGLWEDTEASYYSIDESGTIIEAGAMQTDLQFWIMNTGIELARMELNEHNIDNPERMFTIANKLNKKYIIGKTRQEIFEQLLTLIYSKQLLSLLSGMEQYMRNVALVKAMLKMQSGAKSAVVVNKIELYDKTVRGMLDTLYNIVSFIADSEDIKIEKIELPTTDIKDKTILIDSKHKLSERELYFESGKIMLSFVDHLRPVQDTIIKIMSNFSNVITKIQKK